MSLSNDPTIGKMLDEDGASVTNAAPISAPAIGVEITGDDVDFANLSTIDGGAQGVLAASGAAGAAIDNAGQIDGAVDGVNLLGPDGSLENSGVILSDSRAVNIGEDGASLENAGAILGTGDQRNGTVYVDGNADDVAISNTGLIDAGRGNVGDGVSVQVGVASEDAVNAGFSLDNAGTIAARGTAEFDGGRVGGNGSSGVRFFNGSGTDEATLEGDITNSGSITAEATAGFLGGLVTEDGVAVDGRIENSGLIAGAQNGLYIGDAGHSLEIENAGTISSGSRAVNLDGDNVVFENSGTVLGTGDQRNGTVYLDGTADAVTVDNSGTIDAGLGNMGSGVSVQVGATGDAVSEAIAILNSGAIAGRDTSDAETGDSAGIRFFNGAGPDGGTVTGSIENSGTVSSDTNAGVLIEEGVTFEGTLTNSGIIDGAAGAIEASGSLGGLTVINTGLLLGDVALGDGGDTLDNAGGTITGDIALGGGDDVFVGSVAGEAVDGGEGVDRISFAGATEGLNITVNPDGSGTAVEEFGFSIGHEDAPLASLTTDQTPAELVAEALAGNLYYNIHTESFPSGEIRGQLDTIVSDTTDAGVRTIVLEAALDASQEPGPTSDSLATGSGQVTITVAADGTVSYANTLTVTGLQTDTLLPVAGVSSIHLHNAPAGTNGPVITDIVQDAGGDVTGAALTPEDDTGDGDVFEEAQEVATFTNIEEVEGSDFADSIIASGPAPNVLLGGGGDDFIAGGGATDSLDGGDGIDTNSFFNIGANVVADLGSGSASYQVASGATIFENFANFENLDGSSNDDQLFGDGGANVLTGNDGNDLLAGRGGADVIEGGAGDDIIRGGGGSDVTDGGEGIDTADFSDIGVSVDVSLAEGEGEYFVNGNQIVDTLTNFENLTGSVNDDRLEGDDGDNLLAGGDGADLLLGGAGADVLRGDALGSGEAITVTVTNTLGEGGTFLTPVWFGFHDGENFDLFDLGSAASLGLERLAEDGSVEGVAAEFSAQAGDGGVDATVVGGDGVPGPIDPGESASFSINVDPGQVGNGFFTWATMVIPSNDAFLAVPDDALADPIFDDLGNFIGPVTIQRFGSDVLDAGTELNTEEDAAFLNQTARDQGTAEGGFVAAAPGFNGSVGNPGGTPVNILGGTTAPGAVIDPVEGDFTRNDGGEQLLEIVIDRIAGADDTLNGGAGDDILEGGGGTDTFVFDDGTGDDTVVDFEAGEGGEFLDVSAFGFEDAASVLAAASQQDEDVVIALDADDSVTLESVQIGDLVADNFILEADAGDEVLIGGPGDDVLIVGDETVEVQGGGGNDTAVFDVSLGGADLETIDGGFLVSIADQEVELFDVETFQFADATLQVSSTDEAAQVARLYEAAFDREADLPGITFWTEVAINVGIQVVAEEFLISAEFEAQFGGLGDAAFVENLYNFTLGRGSDTEGFDFWTGVLGGGAGRSDVLLAFSESAEHQALTENLTDDGVLLLG
ncbi:MAG: spondin domain-containing protein [Pseudomonadota bacterium]